MKPILRIAQEKAAFMFFRRQRALFSSCSESRWTRDILTTLTERYWSISLCTVDRARHFDRHSLKSYWTICSRFCKNGCVRVHPNKADGQSGIFPMDTCGGFWSRNTAARLWAMAAMLFMSARIKIWLLRLPPTFSQERKTELNLLRSMSSQYLIETSLAQKWRMKNNEN